MMTAHETAQKVQICRGSRLSPRYTSSGNTKQYQASRSNSDPRREQALRPVATRVSALLARFEFGLDRPRNRPRPFPWAVIVSRCFLYGHRRTVA